MRQSVRFPAVAGTFYPSDPKVLESEVNGYLAAADENPLHFPLRILIVPHAGHVYSGPVAATGYRLLRDLELRRIVMLGPSHYVPFSGLALPGADLLETPLGSVAVDQAGAARLVVDPLVADSVAAHEREHSLEVQLPFLQIVAPDVPVVPLLTGVIDPGDGSRVIEPLLDDDTLLLVSSDLSHFYDHETAQRLDAATAQAIVGLDFDALGRESACGRTGIRIALYLARRRDYRVEVLDLRTSADTAGYPDRVVGYGTFALG